MEYTQNYQLPLWDKEDAVKRTDFNENNQKIDAAVGNLIVTGTYIGSSTDSAIQTIELGFQPRFLLVRDIFKGVSTVPSSNVWSLQYLAIAFPGCDHCYMTVPLVKITETGFTVGHTSITDFNVQGKTYHYLAVR